MNNVDVFEEDKMHPDTSAGANLIAGSVPLCDKLKSQNID